MVDLSDEICGGTKEDVVRLERENFVADEIAVV